MKIATPLLLIGLVAGCAAQEEYDPLCGDRCDLTADDIVWQYAAGEHEWASCSNEADVITCSLAIVDPEIQASQVYVGRADQTGIFMEALTPSSPSYRYNANGDIALSARPPGSWSGDVLREFSRPGPGESVSFGLPFDVWRVSLTKLDDAKVSLITKYDVEIAEGQFLLSKTQRAQYISGFSIPQGEETLGKSYHMPVTAGGKVGVYLSASSAFSGPPHFTIDKPGCYLVNGGVQLIFDEGCVQSQEILGSVPADPDPEPDTCTCDVTAGCDVDCACDLACAETPAEPMCVAGSQYQCDDAGETWADGECCVEGAVQCVTGSQYQCDDSSEGEGWTGELCCVPEDRLCVAGSQYQCDDSGEGWTGTECCVEGNVQCVEGSQYQCDDTGENWTGELCCIDAALSCTSSSQYECDDTFTGELCCQ